MIDEMVRFLAREQFLREDNVARRRARPPSLRKAILAARDIVAARQPIMGTDQSEVGFIRLMERLWNREQKEDVVESYYTLFHWKVTKRIDEVLHELVAEEFGHPPH